MQFETCPQLLLKCDAMYPMLQNLVICKRESPDFLAPWSRYSANPGAGELSKSVHTSKMKELGKQIWSKCFARHRWTDDVFLTVSDLLPDLTPTILLSLPQILGILTWLFTLQHLHVQQNNFILQLPFHFKRYFCIIHNHQFLLWPALYYYVLQPFSASVKYLYISTVIVLAGLILGTS